MKRLRGIVFISILFFFIGLTGFSLVEDVLRMFLPLIDRVVGDIVCNDNGIYSEDFIAV